jgi:hypothetical protein
VSEVSPTGEPVPAPSGDPRLARFREYVAAGIAIIVVVGTGALIVVAITKTSSTDSFTNIKDLLLFINPLLGYVVGYYFSRVSTEGRAESAESVARSTAQAAQEAERSRAETENRRQEASAALADLTQAAAKQDSRRKTLGGESIPADPQLSLALARARAVLGWTQPETQA